MHEKPLMPKAEITPSDALAAMVSFITSFYDDHKKSWRPEMFAQLAEKILGTPDQPYDGFGAYLPPALIDRLKEAKREAEKHRRRMNEQVEQADVPQIAGLAFRGNKLML